MISLAGVALTGLFAAPTAAQTWTGATSNDWTIGTNWSTGVVPAGGTVVINTTSPNPTVLGVGGPTISTSGQLIVGNTTGSVANLTIQNGSTLTSTSGTPSEIGSDPASNGTVTVTGAGSRWITSGTQIRLGAGGNGTLNIQNGAAVTAPTTVNLGTVGGTGTLNINGGGTLETNSLTRAGGGNGQVNFDNAILRALTTNAIGFVGGFTSGTLNIAAGGLTVDTQTFTVGSSSGFSGVGGLTKIGAGTLNLRANNTFSGATVIQAGTLALVSSGSIATSSRVVADGTFNISAMTAAGTSIQSLAGSGAVTLGAKNLTITNANDAFAGIIAGTGGLTISGGKQILTGANSYTGATNVQAGTLVINGNQTAATGLTSVFSGGTLGGTGIIGGDLTAFAGGIIAPGNSIGTLTINGNYTSNGGTLAVEAQLGGDASPADLLLINGNSLLGLAPTLVQVTNVGGLGGVTTNGIKIVDVVGVTSDAGVFVLSGPAIGGAYSYNLFQNDVATGTDGDWYLRSTGVLAPTTPTFENYPVALLGMTELPTLRQRVGDRVEAADAAWSRIEGAAGHYQATSSSTGASYDSSLFLAQIGVEGALIDGDDGSLVAGFSAQYSRNSANVFSAYGNGSNVTEGMGIGATLTWRGAEGTYVDLQSQIARFSTDLDAVGYRLVDDNGGTGLAVGLEAGHEIALDDAWSITPQAQLSYASVGFDSFTDRFGSVISLEAGNSLKGRVGVAVDYRTDWQDEQGRDASASLNGVASLTYELLDGATVAVSGTNLHYAAQKFGGELGLGGTLEWNGGAQTLHAEVLGATSFQGSHAVKGTVGYTAGF